MKKKQLSKDKKGEAFGSLGGMAIGVVTLAVVLTVGFLIMSQGRTQITSITGKNCAVYNASEAFSQPACNATDTLTRAVGDIPGWVPLVIIAGVGAALLGLVSMFQRRKG